MYPPENKCFPKWIEIEKQKQEKPDFMQVYAFKLRLKPDKQIKLSDGKPYKFFISCNMFLQFHPV